MLQSITVIQVYYIRGTEKLLMGKLALKNRKIFFEYAADFLTTGLELSPLKLSLKPGVFSCEDAIFDGLFGVFNDSLPDGWGRLLLDRKLMSLGVNTQTLSPLDRLAYVGSQGMGALVYEPEIISGEPYTQTDLDQIAEEISHVQTYTDIRFVEELLARNGSSAGARPKIVVQLDDQDWLVKFRSSLDPVDIGAMEYAYHLMAKAAGLDVYAAKLFPAKKGAGYFGIQRFDRNADKRMHMHSMSGLLHADYRIPSLDYVALMKATLWLTKDVREAEKQFRAAVFNVFAHNRDDHGKNFSFLMNEQGQWHVSPAYDLTFSSGPAGEHCTTLMGEGKNPTATQLLKLAAISNISKSTAEKIIEEVRYAITQWKDFAEEAGVSKTFVNEIQKSLSRLVK